MKILIETLDEKTIGNDLTWIVDKSKTLQFTNLSKANKKFDELKQTKETTQTIRILEFRNDESDSERKPCKIIKEYV